jgi:hypothetical protein
MIIETGFTAHIFKMNTIERNITVIKKLFLLFVLSMSLNAQAVLIHQITTPVTTLKYTTSYDACMDALGQLYNGAGNSNKTLYAWTEATASTNGTCTFKYDFTSGSSVFHNTGSATVYHSTLCTTSPNTHWNQTSQTCDAPVTCTAPDTYDPLTNTCITPPPTCSHSSGDKSPDVFVSFDTPTINQCDGACVVHANNPSNLTNYMRTSGNCLSQSGNRILNGSGTTQVQGCWFTGTYTGETCSVANQPTPPTASLPNSDQACNDAGGAWNGTSCVQGSEPTTTNPTGTGTGTTTNSTTTNNNGDTSYAQTSNTTTNISTNSINELADKLDISSLNKEATQELIRGDTSAIKQNTEDIKNALTCQGNDCTNLLETIATENAQRESDINADTTTITESITDIQNSYQDAKTSYGWSTWVPEFPNEACTPITGSVLGKTVVIDMCQYVGYLNITLGWLFNLFGAWTIMSLFFRK